MSKKSLLKEVRQKRKLTQEEFAKLMKMPQSRISLIENGKLKIERDVILVLNKKFKVKPEEIIKRMNKGE